jgi:hypothetical protein
MRSGVLGQYRGSVKLGWTILQPYVYSFDVLVRLVAVSCVKNIEPHNT